MEEGLGSERERLGDRGTRLDILSIIGNGKSSMNPTAVVSRISQPEEQDLVTVEATRESVRSSLPLITKISQGPASAPVQVLRRGGVLTQGKILTTKWIALEWPQKAQAIFIYVLSFFFLMRLT